MPHVARLRFTVFKNCLNKNLNIQDGPRLVPKTSKYHIDHHVLHTPHQRRDGGSHRRHSDDLTDVRNDAGRSGQVGLTVAGGDAGNNNCLSFKAFHADFPWSKLLRSRTAVGQECSRPVLPATSAMAHAGPFQNAREAMVGVSLPTER